MSFHTDRRSFLRVLGGSLALPLISQVIPSPASAQMSTRSRFIGVFFPNGAHMPNSINGNWNFDEALAPLVAAGHRDNTMIIRGLHNGIAGIDPHWQNCAGFLSCRRIVLGDAAVARCGKSLDQVVAEQYPTAMRSLEVGAPYYHVHPLNDHPGYSNDYLNRISWQTDDTFRSPIGDPRQMFDKIFGFVDVNAEQVRHLHAKKRSILDFVYRDAERLSSDLPAAYRPVLSTYMNTVREVEQQLDAVDVGCNPSEPRPTQDFADSQRNYVQRYQLMNRMVVLAMQCGLVHSSTFMYGPSSSDLHCEEVLGGGQGHHGCAHNRGEAPLINRLRGMNAVHSGLFAHLLTELKAANLMDSTLVMYGSDMSDGDLHTTENIPTLLCGAGSDLNFGQDINGGRRPMSDLHVDIFNLLGVPNITQWGDEVMASTMQPLPIRA
mgnify:CR=1 FL=1